ncbi:MAG: S8 family serine peptidase [Arenimonas sp.]|uniref:S8 family serine peptidase n=1 Tax=Arenimonas sp. TaxID=1872635 RepID=UPI0025C4B3B5|nr:S8 family serine peptidase [Arenimonas sp.]MBW8367530.1 S8 family serine peptidase [Arenimonas sp.]
MRTAPLMLAVTLGLFLPASDPGAAPGVETVASQSPRATYLVAFDEPAAARFRGFEASDKHRPRLAATSAVATGARKYLAQSVEAQAYVAYLDELRVARLADASRRFGRSLQPRFTYTHAMNGMALELTAAEASQLAGMPGVRSVSPDFKRFLQTDRGPQWIKADQVWNGTATGVANRGEGVIVGVIDSGINRAHSAFAGTGITNPLGGFRGYCAGTPAACNSKLIGLWDFTTSAIGNTTDPVDADGHGTHIASTAVGNAFVRTAVTYSGVAPRANLIMYKACPGTVCDGSALVASINQAVADGVDVINYSIGGPPVDPWLAVGGTINDDSEAFLAAREAGIVVAAAAGDEGPSPGTPGTPANSPGVMGVAAATHDRGGAGVRRDASRGRGPVVPLGVTKPDITAPGVSIIAAGRTPGDAVSVATFSGTSTATPHVAGAAALVRSVNPTINASAVVSALMLTARSTVTDAGAATTPHAQGAGMVDVAKAVRAGLYLDVTPGAFALPVVSPYSGGADALNLPSLAHGACFRSCVITRTFKLMPGANAANYNISATMDSPGAQLLHNRNSFTTSAGGQAVVFTANVDSPALVGKWVHGRVNLTNTSGDGRPNLALPVSIFVSPFATQAAQDALSGITRTVSRERDAFDVDISDVVALPSARFVATPLVAPVTASQPIAASATQLRLVTVPATPAGLPAVKYRLRASSIAATDGLQLAVGRDADGDSQPDANEEVCGSPSSYATEVCQFEVMSTAAPAQYWIALRNESGAAITATLESFVLPLQAMPGSNLVASGPGRTAPGEAFQVRMIHDDPSLVAGQVRVGYLLVQPAAGSTALEVPVRLTRSGASFEAFALANDAPRAVTLPAGASHPRLYFDVPPHATTVQFTTTGSTGNLDLYVARVASPTGPDIQDAPAWDNNVALRAATAGGNETLAVSGANLAPGRWYVVPVNPTGGTVAASVTATVTAQGAPPAMLSGQYVNLARDGHGIFVDFAGPQGAPDQWVTVWYTYLEDSTPTWYYSQGAAPTAAGIWKAELFRVTWDGAATQAVDVGDVIITATAAQAMTLNFNLDGKSGFETMIRVGGGSCPTLNAQNLDVSGHWFSPSLAGFGYTYLATGGANPQEVFIPYVYDGQGFPRWLYGQKNFVAGSSSFDLQWFSGFSPLAAPVGLIGTPAGTGTRTLGTNSVTNMSVNTAFGGALLGTWVQNRAVAMLSQRKNCL